MPKRNGLKVGLFCVLFSFVFIGLQVPLPRCFQVVRQISALETRRELLPKSCLFLLKTTMARASEDCEIPIAARWRSPNSFGMSWLWLTGRMQPAAFYALLRYYPLRRRGEASS